MKKTLFIFVVFFSFSLLLIACKGDKKEDVKEVKAVEEMKMGNHENHDHNTKKMASHVVYQCPMDCEKGKTYDDQGSCPVCKMSLKEKMVNPEEVKQE
ncbi:heavy metal-binding domain-containing protein [Lutibacter sp.]